jgi:hypothetical protein
MKKTIFPLISCLIIFSSLFLVNAQSPKISLTVTTDKQVYCGFGAVTISGTLQQNGVPASDGLIGLQVQDSEGNTLVIRTLRTGTSNLATAAQINSAYLSDQSEHLETSIQAGSLGYFTLNLANNDNTELSMLITINLYDSNGIPIGQISEPCSLMANQRGSAILSLAIPTWSHSGLAYGYADTYTDWPSSGGIPLSLEQAFQFTITDGLSNVSNVYNTSNSQGSYAMTFRLPTMGPVDANYTVYASTSYSGVTSSKTASFNGQFADYYNNGFLDSSDFFFFVNSYIDYSVGNSGWSKLCDMNQDGKINSQDFFLFVDCYITYWSAYQS